MLELNLSYVSKRDPGIANNKPMKKLYGSVLISSQQEVSILFLSLK